MFNSEDVRMLQEAYASVYFDEGYQRDPERGEEEEVFNAYEAYVPLRDSDEMYDDEGFPTRTRKWSKKMTDARMGVGREKAKGRYGTGTPNISKGVSAARKLEKMKKVDDETESVRRKRSEGKANRNRELGANRRSLQTSLDRQHLERSFKKEEIDLYNTILSHLISEGYADNATSALAIMAHMSEEWRESIVEADSIAAMRERAAKRRKQRYGDERFGRDDFKSNAQKKKEADARMQAYLDSKAAEKG
jgi:hypothetical protein